MSGRGHHRAKHNPARGEHRNVLQEYSIVHTDFRKVRWRMQIYSEMLRRRHGCLDSQRRQLRPSGSPPPCPPWKKSNTPLRHRRHPPPETSGRPKAPPPPVARCQRRRPGRLLAKVACAPGPVPAAPGAAWPLCSDGGGKTSPPMRSRVWRGGCSAAAVIGTSLPLSLFGLAGCRRDEGGGTAATRTTCPRS